ncbi:MAG: hypothetical protein WC341_05810 [Bacteroidales bacterium]|jgi:hypothetical protein
MNHFPISKAEFNELATTHDQHCVSIYIPTSGPGEKAETHQGQVKLKNSLKSVQITLSEYGLNTAEIDNYLDPVTDLMADKSFWRNQSDCLAIFLTGQSLRYYTIPGDFNEFTYVSDHFYLKPLLALFNGDGKYYLLTLSLQKVKLFSCTRFSISEVSITGYVPDRLEEVVGYDYRNKSLQYRTGKGGEAGAMFHGQGSGKDDKIMETEKFFRAIDKGLTKLLNKEEAPLVLACVGHYYPLYSKITVNNNLFNKHIDGNHDETEPHRLLEMAWPLVEDYFQQDRIKTQNLMRDLSSNGKTSYDLIDIIPAALDGRVEALFLQKDQDRFGLYDAVNRTVIIDEDQRFSQSSLFNLAAVNTWLNGGQVYISGPSEMPFEGSNMNALFRY